MKERVTIQSDEMDRLHEILSCLQQRHDDHFDAIQFI